MLFYDAPYITQGVTIDCATWLLSPRYQLASPQIVLNGHPLAPASWGRIEIPLPPGRHHLRMSLASLTDPHADTAEYTVTVERDQVVALQYAIPRYPWHRTSLGSALTGRDYLIRLAWYLAFAAAVVTIALVLMYLR